MKQQNNTSRTPARSFLDVARKGLVTLVQFAFSLHPIKATGSVYRALKPNQLLLLGAFSFAGVLCIAFLSVFQPVSAAINEELHFQARLLTAAGGLASDGNYNIQFHIYSDGDGNPGTADETLQWSGSYLKGNTQGVDVVNGYVSAQLGESASAQVNTLADVPWDNDTLWLSINIGDSSSTSTTCTTEADFNSNCGGDGEMGPFLRLGSTPYAFNSKLLGGRDESQFVQLDPGGSAQNINTTNSAISVNQQGTGNIITLQDGGTTVFRVADGGNTLLGSNSTQGNLLLSDGGVTANYITLRAISSLGQDSVITIPDPSGASDTICLVGLGNCAGSGGGVIGSGTTNRVAYWTGGGTIGADDDLFFDGTNLGVGVLSPSERLEVDGNVVFTGGTLVVDNTSDGNQIGRLRIDYNASNNPEVSAVGDTIYFGDSIAFLDNASNFTTRATKTNDLGFYHGRTGDYGHSFYTKNSSGVDTLRVRIGGNDDPNTQINTNLYVGNSTTNQVRIEDGIIAMQDTTDTGRSLRIEATDIIAGQLNSYAYNYSDGAQIASIGSANGELLLDVTGNSSTDSAFRVALDSTGNHPIVNLYNKDSLVSTFYANSSTNFVGIGTSSPDARLEVAGNTTASAWGTNGILLQATSSTFTNSSTAASGTATNAVINSFGTPTLAATNASVTTTNAANVYIQGAPVAGTNQTLTNSYALWVDSGLVRIDDGLLVGADTDKVSTFTLEVQAFTNTSVGVTAGNNTSFSRIYLGYEGSETGGGRLEYDHANATALLYANGGTGLLRLNSASNLTVGGDSVDGELILSLGSSNYLTIDGGATAGSYTLTVPTITANDSFCLAALGNCSGSATTLQAGYTASAGGTTPEIKLDSTRGALDIQDADTTIAGNLLTVRASNGSGLGNILFNVDDTGQGTFAGQLTVEGATLHAPDSTSLFLGANAGQSDDASNNSNTGIGQNALSSVTTGAFNTAIGYNALSSITDGNFNTALGANALASTTGWNNFGIGMGALQNNSGGYYNVGIGVQTLLNKTLGNSNVAIGEQAGYGNGGGDTDFENNIFIGYRSGYTNEGNNNTFIGYASGDNLTTGSNNILLGYNIDVQSATGSNQLSIGNLLFGTGVDGTGTSLSSGKIGIGTAAPGAKLAVAGSSASDIQLLVTGATSQTADLIVAEQIGGSDLFVVDNEGKIGIGIDPSYHVDVSDSGTVQLRLQSTDSGGSGLVRLGENGGHFDIVYNGANNVFELNGAGVSANTAELRFDRDTGRLRYGAAAGVGDTFTGSDPYLHVLFTSSTGDLFRIEQTGGDDYFTVDADGQVGIGINNAPDYLLDVADTGDIIANFQSNDVGGDATLRLSEQSGRVELTYNGANNVFEINGYSNQYNGKLRFDRDSGRLKVGDNTSITDTFTAGDPYFQVASTTTTQLEVLAYGAGNDSYLTLSKLAGTEDWSLGLDADASSAFKLSFDDVLGSNDVLSVTTTGSSTFRTTTDSTTGFRVMDADGGNPILNVDTTNERVTIGSSTAGGKLFVDGSGDEVQLQIQSSSSQTADIVIVENSFGTDLLNITSSGYAYFQNSANTTQAYQFLNSSGGAIFNVDTTNDRVYIGATSGDAKLYVDGDADEIQFRVNGHTTQTAAIFQVQNSGGATLFNVAGSGLVSVAQDINLGDSAADTISFAGTVDTDIVPNADATYDLGSGTNAWDVVHRISESSSSDLRLKKNVSYDSLGIEFINDLNAASWNWNGAKIGDDGRRWQGLIAQDVAAALTDHGFTNPEKWAGFMRDSKSGYLSLNYEQFIGPIIQAVQDVDLKVSDNAKRISALEARVNNNTYKNLFVKDRAEVGQLTVNGHITTKGKAPTQELLGLEKVVEDGSVLSATVKLDGNDISGTIEFETSSFEAADNLIKIKFANAYSEGKIPRVILAPVNADAVTSGVFMNIEETTNKYFTLSATKKLKPLTKYKFNYFIVE